MDIPRDPALTIRHPRAEDFVPMIRMPTRSFINRWRGVVRPYMS